MTYDGPERRVKKKGMYPDRRARDEDEMRPLMSWDDGELSKTKTPDGKFDVTDYDPPPDIRYPADPPF